MATRRRQRRLIDTYRVAGFRPLETVGGEFGDPKARVVTLVRRSKKQPAARVAGYSRAGTINAPVAFAICLAATRESTSSSMCAGSRVELAAR